MANWKSIITAIAPTIGTALGGPLAGTATKFIAESLLGNVNATETDIEAFVLGANPDELTKLRGMENDFKVKMKELNVDVLKIETKDMQSARKMHSGNTFVPILTLMLTAMVALGAWVLIHLAVPDENQSILYLIFGSVMTSWTTAMGYWFGTSKGSSDKNKALKIA